MLCIVVIDVQWVAFISLAPFCPTSVDHHLRYGMLARLRVAEGLQLGKSVK